MCAEDESGPLYITDIFDEIGVSKFQIKVLLIVGIAMIFDGFDYMVVAYTMPQIAAEWSLSAAQTGSLASWGLIGLVIGGVIAGMLADKIGRKKTLVWGTFLYALLSVLIFFVPSYELFSVCRVATGIGLGACIPMANTYNSEYAPTKVRGTFVALGMAFMILGWVLAGVAALFIVPVFGWRFLYLLGGLPLIFSIACHYVLPESALWLVTQGRKKEAISIINMMEKAAKRKVRTWEAEDITVPPRPDRTGVSGLFSKGYALATVGLWINAFCVASIMYGINAWTPSMLLMTGLDTTASYGFSIAQSIAAMVATAGAGFMIERTGRIRGAVIAFALAILSCLVMSWALGSNPAFILGGCIFIGFSVNFATTCPKALTPEVYPTEFRSTAIAYAAAVGRVGGAIAPFVFGAVVGTGLSFAQLMLVLILPLAIGLIALPLCIKRETKGISLEKLHA